MLTVLVLCYSNVKSLYYAFDFNYSPLQIAERYTNMTKIVFHGFYYSTIFPAAFFMSSAALFINYYVDKFSVMVRFVNVYL